MALASLDDVDLGRHRVDLDAQLAGGFVDEIDRLVRQETIGEVSIREHRCTHERVVLDAYTVVHLVAFLQPSQDRDRVVDRRFTDIDLLESSFECRVLLHVLAILVEGRRADHAQLATSKHRFDHVPRIHGALCAARSDERVDLVDEGDDVPLGVGDLLQHRLQALFELAAILRSGEHRRKVERDQTLSFETLWHVAIVDSASKSFDDRGLANARLADEDRVVLRSTRQDLDHATNLLVATDHRIDLAVAGSGREVHAVLLERLKLTLGILGRDAVRAAHVAQRHEQLIRGDADSVVHCQHEVLDGQKVVLQFAAIFVRLGELVGQLTRHPWLAATMCARKLRHGLGCLVANHRRGDTNLGEQRRDDGLRLVHERNHDVIDGQFGIRPGQCILHRKVDGFGGLGGPLAGVQ